MSGINLNAFIKEVRNDDAVGNGANRERGFTTRQGLNDNSNSQHGRGDQEERTLEFFTTPQGEVYGFVDKEGNIYLDETVIVPEHPIHEYTHLWDRAIAKNNPELWNRGVALMQQTSLWQEILDSSTMADTQG